MKRFPAKLLLSFGLLATMALFNACQKEGLNPNPSSIPSVSEIASDRSPEHFTYGVTVFDGVNPSLIVQIDEANGNVVATFQAFVDPGFGTSFSSPVLLQDLKGIARTSWGQFFLTTGPNNTTPLYNNSLMKVNVDPAILPQGLCSFFNSVSPFNLPITDLEFDPVSQHFFGLLNNSNQVVEIADNNNNFTNYLPPVPVTGIDPGTTLKGFSIVRDNVFGLYFVGAANRAGNVFTPTKLYSISPITGVAAFSTQLLPASDFNGGHCGIGFDLNLNHLAINRANLGTGAFFGLSEIDPWAPPFGFTTGTNFWGGFGFNFEDLSSSVY